MKHVSSPSQSAKIGLYSLAVVAISAVVVAAVALALRRPGVVLYSHSHGPGEARFLVSDGTSLRYLRQSVTANSPAVAVDARNYAQFNAAAANGSAPVPYKVGGQVATFSSMGMKFTPAAGPHGFAGVTWGDASFAGNMVTSAVKYPFTAMARTVSVSYWTVLSIALTIAGLTAAPILHQRRAVRRLARGLCLACGYDVRASPDRCPECGRTTLATAAG
jgi:hypothetical protein